MIGHAENSESVEVRSGKSDLGGLVRVALRTILVLYLSPVIVIVLMIGVISVVVQTLFGGGNSTAERVRIREIVDPKGLARGREETLFSISSNPRGTGIRF